MCSSARLGARSPSAVPAKTRRPDAKTASGSSVIVSTTTSPRMPCALRTRPTMMNSGLVIERIVILSAAKDLHFAVEQQVQVLRVAQDDKRYASSLFATGT